MTRGSDASARTAQVTKLLANDKAQFVSFEMRDRMFNYELTRMWPVERDDLLDSAYAYLNTVDTVTDPQVGAHETFTGLWRVVDVQKASYENVAQHNAVSGVVQKLRFGYAQFDGTPDDVPWASARIVNYKSAEGNSQDAAGVLNTASDNPDRFMLIEFVNLDPVTAPDLVHYFANNLTLPAPNITIRGTTYATANYHVIAATMLESEFDLDGSARVQLLIAQPQYTLEAFKEYLALWNGLRAKASVYYLWGVPKDLAQTILDSWDGTNGRSASAEYNRDASLVNLTLVDAMWHTLYGIYSGAVGGGGACSFYDELQFVWGLYDPTHTAYDPANFTDYQSAGVTYDRTVSFDRDTGRFNIFITRRQTLARRYPPYPSTVSHHLYENTYLELGVTDNVYFDMPDDKSESVQGMLYSQTVTPNPDCSKDVRTIYQISEPQSWYDAVLSDGGSVHAFWWYINQRALPDAVIDGLDADNSNRISIAQNQDKTYNVTIASAPGPTAVAGYTPFYYTTVQVHNRKQGDGEVSGTGDREPNNVPTATYYTYRVTYHATEAAAYQSGQVSAIGQLSVQRAGGVWRCERVVHVTSLPLNNNADTFYLEDFYTTVRPTSTMYQEDAPYTIKAPV